MSGVKPLIEAEVPGRVRFNVVHFMRRTTATSIREFVFVADRKCVLKDVVVSVADQSGSSAYNGGSGTIQLEKHPAGSDWADGDQVNLLDSAFSPSNDLSAPGVYSLSSYNKTRDITTTPINKLVGNRSLRMFNPGDILLVNPGGLDDVQLALNFEFCEDLELAQ